MIHIDVYSHGVRLRPEYVAERHAIYGYMQQLVKVDKQYNHKTGAMEIADKKTFAAANQERTEFRMLRANLEPFIAHLEFAAPHVKYQLHYVDCDKWEKGAFKLRPGIKPKDEQQAKALEFVFSADGHNRVLHADTGFGKTVCGYMAMAHFNRRTVAIMEPTHVATWIQDIDVFLDIRKKDILTINGSEQLQTLMDYQELGVLNASLIFISAVTLRNYIKDCEDPTLRGKWKIQPTELFAYLGVGLVIRDEVHESIHALVRQTMYMNVDLCIFLSATLVSDDAFINGIYERVFPPKDRWESNPNEHIEVHSVFYSHDPTLKLRSSGPRGYSHVMLEKSILKDKKLSENFWGLMRDMVEDSFVRTYQDGLKCLVICSTKKMCSYLAKKAEKQWPQFTIGCFLGGSKLAELYERDIVFSTPKGAGTGKDIKNLEVAWNTVAIGSTQLSRQIKGRLRPVKKYPNLSPRYYMLFNKNIPQHRNYEKRRAMDNLGRCKSYKTIEIPYSLNNR